MRRLAWATLIVGSLSVPAAAVGQAPIRSLCASPAQTFCVNVLAFQFDQVFQMERDGVDWYQQTFGVTFEPISSGFLGTTVRTETWLAPSYVAGGDVLMGSTTVAGAGPFMAGDVSPGSELALDPTVFDVGFIFVGGDGAVGCGVNRGPFGGACYEVPEPSTALLFMAGASLLVLVSRRRRRESLLSA